MASKLMIALITASLIAAVIPVSNADSAGVGAAGVQPYKGLIGADSPLYGLKLLYQRIDLALEGNATARLQKHIDLGQERLSEAYAASLTNNTGAVDAALSEYEGNLKAINSTMDDEGIDDVSYIDAGLQLQDQEDSLSDLANESQAPAIDDLYNNTMATVEQVKSGRPFITCDDGTTYFVPPGQMKKIENGGANKTPPGLYKKGYLTPQPLLVDGNVVWPWDATYDGTLAGATNATNVTLAGHGHGKNIAFLNQTVKHGNGHGKGNGQK